MKNVKDLAKLRRLIKSLAVTLVILIFGIVATAFTTEANDGDLKKPSNTASDKHGFKSLFSANNFDPTRPYITQINPKAIPFVHDYIRTQGPSLEKMKIWGRPYFDLFDGILDKYGLPTELKYLSVIESDLTANAVSVAGAVGPWQIMADEAKRMGLRITARADERTNFNKSTHAAAKILKELYSQFKDWTLVIAAYNCGAGRLRQAIRKSGSKNFWDLQNFLPAETRNHVKRFISTHYIFEGSGGLTTMTAGELEDFNNAARFRKRGSSSDENPDIDDLQVAGKYNSSIIAKNIGMDLSEFHKLNPGFDKQVLAGNTYTLTLPNDKVAVFTNKKNTILAESVQLLLNTATGTLK